jgi:hypothetical protein
MEKKQTRSRKTFFFQINLSDRLKWKDIKRERKVQHLKNEKKK